MPPEHMQIGEVAERTGLSLRTIRYYGEVGLAEPSARSQGGFRLYTEDDVQRLLLIGQMKPLGLSLEQMRELLAALDAVDTDDPATIRSATSKEVSARLALYADAAQARAAELQRQLDQVLTFTERLQAAARRQPRHGVR
jgi:DNA-binding transcriptional MerR regulator